MDGTVLVADDDRTIRTVLTQALTRAGCKVHATGSIATLKRWVEEGRGDLVISDVVMPDGNGLEALPEIARMRPGLPVIVISAQNTIMTAIQAAEAEAFDYLPKPFDLPDLMKRVSTGLKRKRLPVGAPKPVTPGDDLPLIGHSPAMQAVYRLVARVMNADLPVLITGASGTGKSLTARALHDYSERRELPFVLVSAEDFAVSGRIEEALQHAREGSLVIDEIADLDTGSQARLTRLLDGFGQIKPRIISTSQQDLSAIDFREDLYFRLSGVQINMPALNQRSDDIGDLSGHFLKAAGQGGTLRNLTPEALKLLRAYPWPGNIRQLENAMHRLSMTSADPEIQKGEVEAILRHFPNAATSGGEDNGLSAAVGTHIGRYFERLGSNLPPAGLYGRILREVELPLLQIALDATGGNQAKCADLLGINRNTLRKKLTELGIEVTRRRKLM